MVDDTMRRFDHLVAFRGKMRVTSRDSMQELIKALNSKYERDVQSSLRLHCLQFFHDLVQSSQQRREETKEGNSRNSKRKEDTPHDTVSIAAQDINDWKDMMTLSKIYYVLEHPRFPGLTWKRRIFKKKKISNFGDRDLIEWRVAQSFRLRGLEEWAQSRKDARKMADQTRYDISEGQKDVDLEELFEMFDPSRKIFVVTQTSAKGTKPKKPFNFESMKDWTESYSEDSEHSDAKDFVEEIDDLSDEMEQEMGEFHITRNLSFDENENISEILSNYHELKPYKTAIFCEMDEAKSIQDWFNIYNKIRMDAPKEKIAKSKVDIETSKIPTIVEEKEETIKDELGTEDVLAKRIDENDPDQSNQEDADETTEDLEIVNEKSPDKNSYEILGSELRSDEEGAEKVDSTEQVVKRLLQDMKTRVRNYVDEDTTEYELQEEHI